MCFTKEMSGGFAALGLFMSIWVYSKTDNMQLAAGVFYFFLMEFLQYFQYLVIDDCENPTNQILTVLGFLHICFQPYFTHIINSALTKSPTYLGYYVPILRMTIIAGVMLFARFALTYHPSFAPASHFEGGGIPGARWEGDEYNSSGVSTEWLRAEKLCTLSGKFHLRWEVPMADVSYYVPSAAIHSFFMFMPFFVIKPKNIIQGLVLWATGPALANYISPDLTEQASIWCFFSISQIAIMLYVIRNVVGVGASVKIDTKHTADAPHIDFFLGWPMGVKGGDPAHKSKKSS